MLVLDIHKAQEVNSIVSLFKITALKSKWNPPPQHTPLLREIFCGIIALNIKMPHKAIWNCKGQTA